MPKKLILKDFDLEEISGVDRPAQPTALVTIIKRDDSPMTASAILSTHIKKHYYDESAKTYSEIQFRDVINEKLWPMGSALKRAVTSIVNDANLDNAQKGLKIDESVAGYASQLKQLLGSEAAVMKFATEVAQSTTTQETTTMSEEVLKQLQDRLEKLEAENTQNAALAKLNDAEKAHMANMDDEAKKAFMALSEEERKKKMQKRDDETLAIGDQVISKADVGAAAFAGLKAQQAIIAKQDDDIKKAQNAAEMATLKKRADDEYGNLPGTTDERAEVLKALGGMSETARTSLETILKSAQATLAKTTERQGVTVTGNPVAKSANEQLEDLAKKHAELHKCDFSTAYTAVLEQNPALYEQTLNH